MTSAPTLTRGTQKVKRPSSGGELSGGSTPSLATMTMFGCQATCKRGCTTSCFVDIHRLYIPSNGTEGMWFEEQFCSSCIHDNPDPDHPKKCEIIVAAMFYYPNDPRYPAEWHYDSTGNPRCSKYVNWNWGENGDPDDPDNPLRPPDPPDPRQLSLFPLLGKEYEELQRVAVR